jgi:hypothetical protein
MPSFKCCKIPSSRYDSSVEFSNVVSRTEAHKNLCFQAFYKQVMFWGQLEITRTIKTESKENRSRSMKGTPWPPAPSHRVTH